MNPNANNQPTDPSQDPFNGQSTPPVNPAQPSAGFTSSASTSQPLTSPAPNPTQNPAVVTPTTEDPGQVLGILGIVLSLVMFAPLGIILGIVSRNRSIAAGHSGTLGKASLIIGVVLTSLAVLAFIAFFVIMMVMMSNDPTLNTY